jgi:hypothetical protein
MDANGLNIYRMSYNDFRNINNYIPYVQHFLASCDYILVADLHHGYPSGILTSTEFNNEVMPKVQALAMACGNDPNLYIEPWNERSNQGSGGSSAQNHYAGDVELAGYAQTVIDWLRNNGYVYGGMKLLAGMFGLT